MKITDFCFIKLRLNCLKKNRPNPGLVTIATNMFHLPLEELCTSRGYFRFRSILCLGHYQIPLYIHKMLLQSYGEEIKQIPSGSINHSNFLGDFYRQSEKLEKVGPTLPSFNSRPSLPSVATNGVKQFLCRDIIVNNKTGT